MTFGTSDFISFLPPPSNSLSAYDYSLPPTEQPSSIPSLFIDAMTVRESVYVQEQDVPLDREVDVDDSLAYHWIAYASVSRRRSSGMNRSHHQADIPAGNDENDAGAAAHGRNMSESSGHRESESSTAIRVPAGTIRLIPPHEDGTPTAQVAPHPTLFPTESYVLLGRLAVVKTYRGLGMGRLLVNAALDWARMNGSGAFCKTMTPAELEARKLEGHTADDPLWKGLVVVHSQKGSVESIWARWGFVRDEGMGEWDEEGIPHVGMWRRVEGPGVVGKGGGR
jgi:predicted GNAT family N-acyltransferase